MSKITVFSGTRATGRLHLGNYFGAVKGYIDLQENPNYQCIYMAVDLHTITTPFDQRGLAQATRDIIMDYLAAGLDPEKAILSIQSAVPEHSYLAFLLSSVVSVAKMQHLPTFKDKVKQHPDSVTMALLNYPVLMAADILLYKAALVPAGLDQEPHIEVTREIARRMNDLYGTSFPETQRFRTPTQYVPSLTGEGKMSKSVEGSSITLSDDLAMIKKRLASCPTDSGRGYISNGFYLDLSQNRTTKAGPIAPSNGVASLMQFVEMFQGKDRRQQYEKAYLAEGLRYGDLKAELAEAIFATLEPIRVKRQEFEAHPEKVDAIIAEGAQRARGIAQETIAEVKEKMGFLLPV
jgi:tryptophanyl-tRNA synthetase